MLCNNNCKKILLLLSHKFHIPCDISVIIYNHLLNTYVKTIIRYWYSHIMIHNMNPCRIISNLSVLSGNYDNILFNYFDLTDKKLGITFNICLKYIDFKISSFEWWMSQIDLAFNGTLLFNDTDREVCKFNFSAINNFYNKFMDYHSRRLN